MYSAAVQEVFNRHIQKNGIPSEMEKQIEERARDDGKRETAIEMLNRGFDLKEISEIIKKPLEWVQSIKA